MGDAPLRLAVERTEDGGGASAADLVWRYAGGQRAGLPLCSESAVRERAQLEMTAGGQSAVSRQPGWQPGSLPSRRSADSQFVIRYIVAPSPVWGRYFLFGC